jgi:hypothetical protein
MMRNPIYIGRVESPDYGVSVHGDFESLVDEASFYRAQAVLDGRVVVAGPRQRHHRILPRASDLWVQASLDYKQRLQQLFFPEGIAFDGNRFSRTVIVQRHQGDVTYTSLRDWALRGHLPIVRVPVPPLVV